ncbi:MAG: 2-5 ligase [Gemmatimonadetes bacterium]|nr:2-5 ligase [Gemmatimonadota bacterium]
MRLFLAIELPHDLLDALESAIAPLRADSPEIAWVPPTKRHLTLKFLGEVSDERLDRVVAFADGVARQQRPFSMQLGGIGAFPNFRRARVVWIGVEHEARLELLHHDLEVAGEAEGFALEGRAFRPHVTLARVHSALGIERARRLARAARRIDFSATVDVGEIMLFESTLAQSGATYRRVHAAQLAGGGR